MTTKKELQETIEELKERVDELEDQVDNIEEDTHKGVTSKEDCNKAASYIMFGLSWDDTVEGEKFWTKVYHRLNEYGE